MAYKGRFLSISDEEFRVAVANSQFYRDILINLGYGKNSGSMNKIIKARIERLGIDVSHIGYGKGKEKVRGGNGKSIYTLDDILVKQSNYRNTAHLKVRLLRNRLLDYMCAVCGNNGEWNGRKLVLQLDHINGTNNDHRLENLRLLCPNCHSQTETYSGRNNKLS